MHMPAMAFNGKRPYVAGRRPQRMDRPILIRHATVRHLAQNGCTPPWTKRARKGTPFLGSRQALAKCFQARLLPRPVPEEGFSVEWL
ncbi:hypothetical protein GCM10027292_21990 [Hydrogenophaga aquatica]